MRSKGIANDTTVVLYGDKNNWWACYAFWVFKLYGHEKCLIINGGRKRWELDGKPLVREPEPTFPATEYQARDADLSIRAFRDEVLKHARAGKPLVDVRSPGEYTGQLLHMPDYPQEGALRGGHIPGAVNIPWSKAANEDGTFKSAKDLEQLYLKGAGLKRGTRVVAYCRIGERSSHTWFVLHYLLGFKNVKNYDGSWTEWGNAVGVPVERGPGTPAAASTAPPATLAGAQTPRPTKPPPGMRRRPATWQPIMLRPAMPPRNKNGPQALQCSPRRMTARMPPNHPSRNRPGIPPVSVSRNRPDVASRQQTRSDRR